MKYLIAYNVNVTQITKEFENLLKKSRVKHFPRGQIIYYEGDSPTDVMVIKHGVIKLYNINDQGNEKILHILGPDAIIPLRFTTHHSEPLKWFYSALVDADLYIIQKSEIFDLMARDDESETYLMDWFSDEVHELLVRLDSLNKTNARDKIIGALKFLVVKHATLRRSGWYRVNFPISHQVIADIIGMTRESTAIAMKELADAGYIRNPRMTILEIDFRKLCNGEGEN